MSALARIRELEDSGITLVAQGGRLHWRAPTGRMTPDVIAWLHDHKDELLTALTVWRAWDVTLPGRAPFVMLDPGGCTQAQAERAARFRWPDATVTQHTGAQS